MVLTAVFPATRWSLVQRLGNTDGTGGAGSISNSAGILIERYVPGIRAYLALKFPGDRPDYIDDLSQEVITALLEKPDVLARAADNTSRQFRYYLMRVSWNLARNARRRLQHVREVAGDDMLDSTQAQAANNEPPDLDALEMDAAWAMGIVDLALHDCHGWETQADVDIEAPATNILKMSLFQGKGIREIAKDLQMSRATCARRLAAAKHLLIKAIIDHLRAAGELDHDAVAHDAHTLLQQALRRDCS